MARINNLPLLLVPPGLRELMTPEELEQCNKDILNEYTGGKPFSRETLPDLIQVRPVGGTLISTVTSD